MNNSKEIKKNRTVLYIIISIILLVLILLIYKFVPVTYNTALKMSVFLKNPSVCEKMRWHVTYGDVDITHEHSVKLCKSQYAILSKDLDYCLTLKETPDSYESPSGVSTPIGIAQRDVCLNGLAHELQRPDLCEMLNSAKDSDYGNVYVATCKSRALNPDYKPVRHLYSLPDFNFL